MYSIFSARLVPIVNRAYPLTHLIDNGKTAKEGTRGVDSIHSPIKSVYNSCGDIGSSLISPTSKYFGISISLHSCTYLDASLRSTSLFFSNLHSRQDLSLSQLLLRIVQYPPFPYF